MKTKEELIFQALGAASMCWTGAPSGTFDSTRCKQIGDELISALENAEALKTANNKQSNTITCSMCKHTGCGLRAAGLKYDVGCLFAERK